MRANKNNGRPLKYLKLACNTCKLEYWFKFELPENQENPEPTKIQFVRAIQARH